MVSQDAPDEPIPEPIPEPKPIPIHSGCLIPEYNWYKKDRIKRDRQRTWLEKDQQEKEAKNIDAIVFSALFLFLFVLAILFARYGM